MAVPIVQPERPAKKQPRVLSDTAARALSAALIFVSSFLLFEAEPMVGKALLPWFGGSAGVWAAALLFFQLVLLAGYAFAHLLATHLNSQWQHRAQLICCAVAVAALPILPARSLMPRSPEHPITRLLWILTITAAVPYFVLSANGPLVQVWYARMNSRDPYRLFAISNAASLLALITYPMWMEPAWPLRIQARFWSFAFAVVVALLAALAFGRQRSVADSALEPSAPITVATERPRLSEQFLWAALPACASALLLAVTNQLTENVAPIPFLWIVPLTLYLLSFVLCFARANLYHRPIFLRIWAVSAAGMLYALKPEYANAPMRLLLPLFAGGLFFCCVALHGEAARLKPEPRWLTRYYLLLATGGAVGGAFVAVIAPVTFSATDELPLSLAACAVLVFCALLVERRSYFYRAQKRLATAIVAVLVIGFVGATAYMLEQPVEGVRLQLRNFYGPLRVVDTDVNPLRARRELINGNINHGVQFLAPGRHMLATSYYGPQSGVAVALLSKTKHHPALRVGIIGLGAGTIATYGRAGDQYTFYEINPLVVSVAQHQFTFLRDCRAKISIVVGDARLSLMRQPPQGFDVLAVDAFTGDSIPVHLLTLQAFEQYFRHLRPDGILAVHISNSFMNLQPVLWAAAKALHKPAAVIRNGPDEAKGIFKATWVLMGADENDEEFESGMIAELGDRLNAKPQIRTWTDDYSNPLRLMVF